MQDSKPVSVPIPVGIKLLVEQCPKTQEEEDMSCVPYASAVGSLMYAMVCTRLDISHVVGLLSRIMLNPGKEHWTLVKRVFRYLCGTSDYGLCYHGRPVGNMMQSVVLDGNPLNEDEDMGVLACVVLDGNTPDE